MFVDIQVINVVFIELGGGPFYSKAAQVHMQCIMLSNVQHGVA